LTLGTHADFHQPPANLTKYEEGSVEFRCYSV